MDVFKNEALSRVVRVWVRLLGWGLMLIAEPEGKVHNPGDSADRQVEQRLQGQDGLVPAYACKSLWGMWKVNCSIVILNPSPAMLSLGSALI